MLQEFFYLSMKGIYHLFFPSLINVKRSSVSHLYAIIVILC